jgi:hypothetical protein
MRESPAIRIMRRMSKDNREFFERRRERERQEEIRRAIEEAERAVQDFFREYNRI